jgi:putative ABC transport system permease protein
MDNLLQDLRFALRSIRSSRLITAAAVLSLALGIGATTAIFSAVDVFMIRPLPYPGAERLVSVYTAVPDRGWTEASSALPDIVDWRDAAGSIQVAAFRSEGMNLSGTDRPERLSALVASANMPAVIGVQPAVGRAFLPEEELDGAGQVAMLSDGLWRDRFGSDPAVVGSTINLDGLTYSVVGVLPPKFQFPQGTYDVWVPWQVTGEEDRRSQSWNVLGRLSDGATIEQARDELGRIAAGLEEAFPESNQGRTTNLIPLRDDIYDEGFRQGSLISSVAVVLVLLIACANVANLLLARGAGRQREMALRGALGAGRRRLARQLLTESLLLSLFGGILGVLVALFGIKGLVSMMPAFFPQRDLVALDGRVLTFMAAVTVASAFIFGLAPSLQVSSVQLRDALSEGGRGSSGGARAGRLRRGLVLAEVSLSVVLLISAALMVRTYAAMKDIDLGYRTENVLTARLSLPEAKYPDREALNAFWREALERVEAIPGVEIAGATSTIPTYGNNMTYYGIPTEEPAPAGQQPIVSIKYVTPGYLEAMEIELVRGRALEERDREDTAPVVLINEAMARRHWDGADPLGELVAFSSSTPEIVGVVSDTREWGPDSDPFPIVYLNAYTSTSRTMGLTIRTAGDPHEILDEFRATILALDPDQPLYDALSMEEVMREEMGGNMVMVKILGVLGVLAFLLAVVGVYGVIAYSVARRTQEMGVRMALGAERADVLRLVVFQGTRMGATGVAIGLLLSLGVTRGLSFFLFGVDPLDPVAFGSVAVVLLASAVLASYFPALKATRVDPVTAFRAD